MINLIIVSIVFGSIVALAALICGTILLIAKIRSSNGAPRASDREETRIIQEIYQGLSKMENRIEALEIILTENIKREQQAKEKNREGEKIWQE